jgi:carbon starvation protein CstA
VFLGTIGGTVAVLGVIVLPITSGTPFRAARMIIADYLKIDQKALKTDYDCNTAFVIAFILTKIDFQLLWRYFFLGKSKYISYCLMDWNRIFIQKKTLISSH